jgi:aminoglycoside 6'-N-acetyltransferase
MSAAAGYEFHALSCSDLAMVRRWLAASHVSQWWGNADEQFELISGDLVHSSMDQFIVAIDDRPFAHLQCYDPTAWPENGFGSFPKDTRGIDQFIGEPEMIDRGHGSAFIRAFVQDLLTAGTLRVVTDPAAANTRAIRAYEKAGFRKEGLSKRRTAWQFSWCSTYDRLLSA